MGYIRLVLALMVMAQHLANAHPIGYWAVWGFFALAGYTLTAAIQGPYQGRRRAFLLGRVWRLYPAYWVVWVLTVLWLQVASPLPGMGLGEVPGSFFLDLPYSWSGATSPVGQAWFITFYLIFALAMALGLCRLSVVPYWLAASAFAATLHPEYQSLAWASLPIAVGSALYWMPGFSIPREKEFWDVWAGRLSYPIFLSHFLIGNVLAWSFGLVPSWPLFGWSLVPTLAASWLLWRYVEIPVGRYRKSIAIRP
jgi:peptidoglycan/LPS O-acetylase OafA/YrhL